MPVSEKRSSIKSWKLLFRLGYGLCLGRGVGTAFLQDRYYAVADVHLIVKIFPLQLEQLPVKLGDKVRPHLGKHVGVEQRAVKRADYVKPYMRGIGRTGRYMHTLQQVVDYVAGHANALHHLI